MPTLLDKTLDSKNTFFAFAGIVTAVAAWSIWGGDMFPKAEDAVGDPEIWSREDLRRWLAARGFHPDSKDTNEKMLERVKANLRLPRA